MAIIFHAFGRYWQGLLVVLPVIALSGRGGNNRVAEARPTLQTPYGTNSTVFSPQWVEDFSGHKRGCELGRVTYTWRSSGFGSNINNLLNAWVYAVAVKGWSDLAVLLDDTQLPELECSHESRGLASHGWSCLFNHMPHLCTFDTPELWKRHLNLTGVSAEDEKEANRIAGALGVVRNANISVSLEALGVDYRGARTVMTKILWGHRTPWLRRDVRTVTRVRPVFKTSPFIAIHVRRGDKVAVQGDRFEHDVEDYLAEAVRFLEQGPDGISVSAIKGIWVASDASDVVNKVRALSSAYFPGVRSEDIVYAGGGVPGGVQTSAMTTHSISQGYGSMVYLIADLDQLAAADVFVGTCSSNLGRLVMVLRDGLGKTSNTSISLDRPWYPKRERSLGLH